MIFTDTLKVNELSFVPGETSYFIIALKKARK